MADTVSNINADTVLYFLERALDGSAKRQKIINNNIANVDTPNFKRSDVNFQEVLKRSIGSSGSLPLAVSDKHHLSNLDSSAADFVVTQDTNTVFRNDGNNVDIEKEIVSMTENNVLYNIYTQLLTTKLGMLRYTIEGGK